METVSKTTGERRLRMRYHCSAGFEEEITYIDPDGKGFAFNKYGLAFAVKHKDFHRHLEKLKQKHPSRCNGLRATAI